MMTGPDPKQYSLNIPIVVVALLLVLLFGFTTTLNILAWVFALIACLAIVGLNFAITHANQRSSKFKIRIELGNLRYGETPTQQSPSPVRYTWMISLAVFALVAIMGQPLVILMCAVSLLEFLPNSPSVWDEYLADQFRRACLQAAAVAFAASAMCMPLPATPLERLAVMSGAYLLALQVYLWRWQQNEAEDPESENIESE